MTRNTKEKKTTVKVRVTDKVGAGLRLNGALHKTGAIVELALTDGDLERLGSNPLLELVK